MSVPDFERAEYLEPRVIEGQVVGGSAAREDRFALAVMFGVGAAIAGALGYALVGLSGFMISIVAIGMAWLIAKAMMTASSGVGGRRYQIVAVILTYLSVSLGALLHPMWRLHGEGMPVGAMMNAMALKYLLLGPLLELEGGLNGILSLVILAIGMRAAWQMTAGTRAAI